MAFTRPLFLAFGLAAIVGCTTGDFCSQALEKQMKCATAEQRAQLEAQFESNRKECRDRKVRDHDVETAEQACVQKASCEEYTSCMAALAEARAKGNEQK